TLRLRDVAAEAPDGHGGEVFAVAFAAGGTQVLSGGWDGRVVVWEAESGNPVASVQVGPKPVSALTVTPDGKHWLTGTLDGVLAWWDARTRKLIRKQVIHPRPVSAIRVSDDGKKLVTASWDRRITLWDLGTEGETRPLSGHDDIVAGCCFTPDS